MTADPPPKRVAIVNSGYHGGGAERVAREMFHWLHARGADTTMYVGTSGRRDLPPGVRRLRLPGERYLRAFEAAGTCRDWRHVGSRLALRRFPSLYDVTHVHNLHGGYLSLRAVHRLCERMPVVWSLHDEFAVTGGLPGDFSRVMDRSEILATWGSVRGMVKDDGKSDRYYAFVDRWMPRPAALVCHSKYILGLVRACPRWRLTPAHLARIPVPMQHEPASRGDRGAAKSRFGFGRAEPVVLMAANHFAIPHKGMAFGARALGLLPRDRFRVLLIGGGAEDVARQIPQASVCPGSIRSTEEMAWAYRAADVTLVPSVVESFGLVAAESMACETPVVGFRVGGLPELAGEGSRGLLAPPLDTAELAANVRRLLDDPELRRRLGVAGRDWIAANCDADRSFERVFEIYAEAQATFRTSRGAAPVTTP